MDDPTAAFFWAVSPFILELFTRRVASPCRFSGGVQVGVQAEVTDDDGLIRSGFSRQGVQGVARSNRQVCSAGCVTFERRAISSYNFPCRLCVARVPDSGLLKAILGMTIVCNERLLQCSTL